MKQKTELGNERKEKWGWLSAVVPALPEGHLFSLPDHSEGSTVHNADAGVQTDLTSVPVGHLLTTSETKVGATLLPLEGRNDRSEKMVFDLSQEGPTKPPLWTRWQLQEMFRKRQGMTYKWTLHFSLSPGYFVHVCHVPVHCGKRLCT